jgi:3-dehydroquinate synthase
MQVEVQLGDRSYAIDIGCGLLDRNECWRDAIRGRQVLLLSDSQVAPHYAARVAAGLSGLKVAAMTIPAGETSKTLASAERVFLALAELGAQRNACLIALGGGVIGDLGGFAAALWMRGIDFIQMPTSLLAMVDSSVGGKTAVNLAHGKNLVGAFWQPRRVIADIDTLATLPEREYRAGLAEVVKYGAIVDAAFFAWLEANADALNDRQPAALIEAVVRSCEHKARIVERDERETGDRALLNFGHTYGHALETIGEYTRWLHGEAVAIGMVMAADLSTQLGMATVSDADRLVNLLDRLGLPTSADVRADRVVELMRLDKKALSDRLRLILWRGLGRAQLVDDVPAEAIAAALQADSQSRLDSDRRGRR